MSLLEVFHSPKAVTACRCWKLILSPEAVRCWKLIHSPEAVHCWGGKVVPYSEAPGKFLHVLHRAPFAKIHRARNRV